MYMYSQSINVHVHTCIYLLILHVGNLGIFIVAVYFKSVLSFHS